MINIKSSILGGFAIVLAAQSPSPASTGQRAEVPIHETVLQDGSRRYSVPIEVGATQIEAGLDTGSTGLRVLPNNLKHDDVDPTSASDYMSFGGGTKLEGTVAKASIAVGGLRSNTTVQLIQRVSCTDAKPACPAASIPFANFSLMAGGLTHRAEPTKGFDAILGLNMADSNDVPNPLRGMGIHRWIIDLPRPGEPKSGRLILNPTSSESSGYTMVNTIDEADTFHSSLHDALRGCLYNKATKEKFCGAVVLDTGDPGLRVVRAGAPAQMWSLGTPAEIFFVNRAGQVHISQTFTIGQAVQATQLVFENRPGARTNFILTGVIPYLAYSVLYDSEFGLIGFKARPPLLGLPQAVSVN